MSGAWLLWLRPAPRVVGAQGFMMARQPYSALAVGHEGDCRNKKASLLSSMVPFSGGQRRQGDLRWLPANCHCANQASKQANPPLRTSTPTNGRNVPPSLTSASVMVYHFPLHTVSRLPHHWSSSNRNWSMQAPWPRTSTSWYVNRAPTGRAAQV